MDVGLSGFRIVRFSAEKNNYYRKERNYETYKFDLAESSRIF